LTRSGSAPPVSIRGARKAPLPDMILPELASIAESAPEGGGWLHEIKYDGYRLLIRVKDHRARLYTRNGNDWTERFSSIADAAARLPVREAWLDGEAVVTRPDGTTSFQDLQNALSSGKMDALSCYVFDIMYLDGYDLRAAALIDRKKLLEALITAAGAKDARIRYSDHVTGHGGVFLERACGYHVEGVISKSLGSPYVSGRTRSWLKSRCYQRQEFVIGGYTEGRGGRSGFGALILGVYGPDGLQYKGRAGTGFDERLLTGLGVRLRKIKTGTCPFSDPPTGPGAREIQWVRPKLVAEVSFTGWTEGGVMRHPVFVGLREDKPAKEVVMEETRTALPAIGGAGEYLIEGVALTNPDRVLYPETGLTKAGLAGYYMTVAGLMLPHLKGRPLTLVRCPEGRDKECFYQKHADRNVPEKLPRIPLKEDGKKYDYMAAESRADIMRLVRMGVLEIHTWGSRTDRVEYPDRIVFDIDPGPDVAWKKVAAVAILLRDRLLELGLTSFLKTTGGKGLHVVVPIERRHGWDETAAFAKAVAEDFAKAFPRELTSSPAKNKRASRIFIDYLRNLRGATAVEVYSTRAMEGAPVAAPIAWEEIYDGERPGPFTVKNLPVRLKALKKDPWEDYFRVRQRITKEMKKKLGIP
jgi:bifunctional non-homologous end joining protein LigD